MAKYLRRLRSQFRIGSNYYVGVGSAIVMTNEKGASGGGVNQCNILTVTTSGITSNSYDFKDGGASNNTSTGIMTVTYVDNWLNKKDTDGGGKFIKGTANPTVTARMGLVAGGGGGSWGGGGGGGYGYGSYTLNPGTYEIRIGGQASNTHLKHVYNPAPGGTIGAGITAIGGSPAPGRTGGTSGNCSVFGFPSANGGGSGHRDPEAPRGAGGGGGGGAGGGGGPEGTEGDSGGGGSGLSYNSEQSGDVFLVGWGFSGGGGGGAYTQGDQGGGSGGGAYGGGPYYNSGTSFFGGGSGGGGGGGGSGRLVIRFQQADSTVGRGSSAFK